MILMMFMADGQSSGRRLGRKKVSESQGPFSKRCFCCACCRQKAPKAALSPNNGPTLAMIEPRGFAWDGEIGKLGVADLLADTFTQSGFEGVDDFAHNRALIVCHYCDLRLA